MNPHSITLPQFVLEPSAAESLAQSLNLPSVLHLLPRLVHSAQSFARPIISNFHVAAVGLGSDGRVFVGVNLEFAGLPLHHSVHAEQFLLTNLALHGCPRLLSFAVSDAPCGHCRQFYQELRHSSSLQILVIDGRTCVENHHGSESLEIEPPDYLPLSKILPNPFGPRDLLAQEAPLLLERHDNGLDLYLPTDASENQNFDQISIGKIENFEKGVTILRKAALEAANNAHAPYSGCPSGVALLDCEGNVYKGSYVESAAYNPSFGPVQAALVAYVARGGGNYDRIVEAVLVEKEDAKVKQEDTARILLKAVSPKCEFRAFYCQSLGHVCEKVSV